MVGIRFTERGKRFILFSCTVLVIGAVFTDYAIIAFALLLLSVTSYSVFDARRLINGPARAELDSGRYSTLAGTPVKVEIRSEGLGGWNGILKGAPEFGEFVFAEQGTAVTGTIPLASLRRLKVLEVRSKSRYGLFEVTKEVTIEPPSEVLVYPRFVVPLYRLLGYEAQQEFGEPSTLRIAVASTGEYAGTRNYFPGDDPRFIDWKATARSQELKLKEFTSEAGQYNLVLDTTSTDAVSADLLATHFMSSLADLLDSGAYVRVTLYDGMKFRTVKPRYIYSETAEAALSMMGRYFPELGRIIDLPIQRWLEHEKEDRGGRTDEPMTGIPASGRTIVVSQLLSDVPDYLTRAPRSIDTVIQPTSPWLYVGSLEDAYLAKNQVIRCTESLRRAGVRVIELSASGDLAGNGLAAAEEKVDNIAGRLTKR